MTELTARVERWVPRLLWLTMLAFAWGSSTVDLFELVGRPLRWACLLLLAGSGLVLALALGRGRRPPCPLVLAASFAALLVGTAVVSAAWSVDPRLTIGRAGSLGVLLVAAAALAAAAATREALGSRLLDANLAAAVVIALGGLVVMAFVYSDAVQPATEQYGSRYRGIGQNPNTMASLFAVVLPLAAWRFVESSRRRARVIYAAVFLLLDGSIVASGSRGAILSSAVALLVLVAAVPRSPARVRGALAAAAVVVTIANVALAQIPNATRSAGTPRPPVGTRNAQRILPLEGEIGRGPLDRPKPKIKRTLLGGSGRSQAWRGALDQAADRPLLGYGFGTEEKVFVDRYYYFVSGAPENSYIGMALQLGATGVVLLVALVLSLLLGAFRRPAVAPAVAAAGTVLVAGLALACTQSYLLSVGNVATGSVWICGFLALARGHGAKTDMSATADS